MNNNNNNNKDTTRDSLKWAFGSFPFNLNTQRQNTVIIKKTPMLPKKISSENSLINRFETMLFTNTFLD